MALLASTHLILTRYNSSCGYRLITSSHGLLRLINFFWTTWSHLCYLCVTGFTKIVLIGTRNEIHFIADYWTYTLALPKNTKHIAIDGQVCFYWRLIADPIKPPWCNTETVGPVDGTNKDVTGARLLPTTVSTCPVDWVPFCHSLKTQHCCLCPYGSFNPPPPPTPPPPTHPYNMPFLILQSLWKKLLNNQQC